MRHPTLRLALGLLALLLLAGALRAEMDVMVVHPDGIHFTVPGDPYYHMRRIAYTAERFPETLSFDRYLNHPRGGQVVWTPAFDWAIAAAARVLVGADDPAGVERVAARVPAVIGTLAVLGVVLLGRRWLPPGAGWVAGALLAVLPNHVLHSQVGQLDHHVAVSFFTLVLLAATMVWPRASRASARASGALGLVFAAAVLLWPGMLLHVGLLDGMLVVWALSAGDGGGLAAERARSVAWVNAGAFVGVTPFAIGQPWVEFGPWSPWVLSNFQPAFFLAAATTLAAAGWVFDRARLAAGRTGRIALAVGIGGAGLGLAFLLIPGLAEVLAIAAGWFAKEEAFQQNVSELRPFYPRAAVSRFSWLVLAFPLAWAWLAWRSWRDRVDVDRFLLLGMAAAFFALAALQRRFGNSFAVLYVLIWGWAAAVLAPRIRAATAERRSLRIASIAVATLAALLVIDSLYGFWGPRFETLSSARRDPEMARLGAQGARHRLFDAAGSWLGRESPPTRGWLDPDAVPEYGVLTRWDAGHMVRYRARRPVVQDNFGVYGGREGYEAAARYYAAEDESEALATLEALAVRYVLADLEEAGLRRLRSPASMATRLATSFGDAVAHGGTELPALSHHRLLWLERAGGGAGFAAPDDGFLLGVWEIVRGARVVGRAAPGARVEAQLPLRASSGRRHLHRAATRADASGRYTLVLPYPTDRPWSSAMSGESAWRFSSAGQRAALAIAEAAVQAGDEVAGPDFDSAER